MEVDIRNWNGRRYYSLDCYLKQRFGTKLYKLALNGGMTCPNRDGTLSSGGCIFCSGGGSGEFTPSVRHTMEEQFEQAKALVRQKYDGSRYIAYFQAFTNTYAPVEQLRNLFFPVIRREEVAVLSIATRPDCLEEDKIELIRELCRIKPVWVELGLQTIHERTARLIRRGYDLPCFDRAVRRLKEAGAEVIVHTITGLPFETPDDMLQTAVYVGNSGADGVKLQLLHVLEGTDLATMYRRGEFEVLREEEYVSLTAEILSVLPERIVIHRLTGDGDKRLLIAPRWSGDKRHVLNAIQHELKIRNLRQGCKAVTV